MDHPRQIHHRRFGEIVSQVAREIALGSATAITRSFTFQVLGQTETAGTAGFEFRRRVTRFEHCAGSCVPELNRNELIAERRTCWLRTTLIQGPIC
jgi:hypothetical protein